MGTPSNTVVLRTEIAPPKPELRGRVLARIFIVLVSVGVAYHFTLLTLLRELASDTPLAYLGLVPFISLILVVARLLLRRPEPNIHDRHLDYIAGVPMLLAAMVMVVLLPVPLSTFFWLWRIDLLSLPLFIAGITSIVFGVRAFWRLKLPIAFLLFAWPVPYEYGINNWIDAFTNVTVGALRHLVAAVPVAHPDESMGASFFAVTHAGHAFSVGVSTACSGANGLVGFLLIGAAFMVVVRGGVARKVAWLAIGLTLAWCLNLLRIMLIFAAGAAWGESFAIDGLHPFIGLVTFNAGVLVMLLTMPLFRLRIGIPRLGRRLAARDIALAWVRLGGIKPAVKRASLALFVVVFASALAAPADASMARFELLAHDLGPPRLALTSDANAGIPGWQLAQTAQYDWAHRYFGNGASWDRYVYTWDPDLGRLSDYRSTTPVTMDVIRTLDLHTFTQYGIQACYRFHNYRVLTDQQVDLGGGVTGHGLAYDIPELHETWSAVYWEWPVDNGGTTTYERVLLNRVDYGDESPIAPPVHLDPTRALGMAMSNAVGGGHGQGTDTSSLKPLAFLVSFSRHVLASAANRSAPVAARSAS